MRASGDAGLWRAHKVLQHRVRAACALSLFDIVHLGSRVGPFVWRKPSRRVARRCKRLQVCELHILRGHQLFRGLLERGGLRCPQGKPQLEESIGPPDEGLVPAEQADKVV